MAATLFTMDESQRTREYHANCSIPTKGSVKVIQTGAMSEPKACEWLIA